ncbi:MAG: hypothetical protein ACPLW8_04935 [Candidatus Bathyarchaeales archaeon]
MLIIRWCQIQFACSKDEKKFEGRVKAHCSEIFGKSSLYFDIKPELRSGRWHRLLVAQRNA